MKNYKQAPCNGECKNRSEKMGHIYCYQCDKPTSWLAPDGRCKDCTRYTPEEIQGEERRASESRKNMEKIFNKALLSIDWSSMLDS